MKAEHIGLLILFGVLLLTAIPTLLSGSLPDDPDFVVVAVLSIALVIWAYIVKYKRKRDDPDRS